MLRLKIDRHQEFRLTALRGRSEDLHAHVEAAFPAVRMGAAHTD